MQRKWQTQAAGSDNAYVELLKVLNEEGNKLLKQLINGPEAIFITIPKKVTPINTRSSS